MISRQVGLYGKFTSWIALSHLQELIEFSIVQMAKLELSLELLK